MFNDGNDYNASSGVFTCRLPGHYWFSASIGQKWAIYEHEDTRINCYMLLNGVRMFEMYNHPYIISVESRTLTGSAGFRLNIGHQVNVGCVNTGGILDGDNTYFSGVLVRKIDEVYDEDSIF